MSESTETDQSSVSVGNQFICFGNFHSHTATLALSLILSLLWTGFIISEVRCCGISIPTFLAFVFILFILLLSLYGNRKNNVIYYYPIIYFVRPILIISIVYDAFSIHDVMYGNMNNRHDFSDSYRNNRTWMCFSMLWNIVTSSVLLYICNIFAIDSVYIIQALKRPALSTFSVHFENLKSRLTQNQ